MDTKYREFILEGIDCANCAAKIENKIKNIPEIKYASLDFLSKKLKFEIYNEDKIDEVIKNIKLAINSIEPDAEIIYDGKKKKDKNKSEKIELILFWIGTAVYAVAAAFKFSFYTELILYLISYIIISKNVFLKAAKNISHGQIFDENFLMCIASIGAFSVKQFPEAVAVMLFNRVGDYFQDRAVDKSKRSISSLMEIKPDFANVKMDSGFEKIDPENVNIGDVILIKPGEKIPLDAEVIDGSSMVDTSALTGESLPREINCGDMVLGGYINKNGVLVAKVTKNFKESTVAKILDLVENASSRKAPTEKFITKFARYYTPVVVALAAVLAIFPPLIFDDDFSKWFYRALIFLVISCPCAIVISVPLGFFGGIGGASKNGILVKGGNYLEALNDIDTIVFDKTGTLTEGTFKVTDVKPFNGFKKEDVLKYAALAEAFSNHPIALSILKFYGENVDKDLVEKYMEVSGKGVTAYIDGKEILAGNSNFMIEKKISYDESDNIGTVVHVAFNRIYMGYILISDEIKKDSKDAINKLKDMGIKNIAMLTGDNEKIGKLVASKLGIDKVYTELLPDEKVERLEYIDGRKGNNKKMAFVGDGINDAPVLARADVGIAMGGIGSDAAIEAADVVIMTDEPSKIAVAIKIARRTKSIVTQNIVFSLGVKFIILILGAVGIANMWGAVFSDVGVAIIAVLNSMRALKVKL
ncbi:Cd2+/Zn2+-exporting ATPase [Clostridium algifaecis]|uniref:Cd(2+)-exporting ATPase n=1 Tax=Clostridium algifaecis TaxID=1472040 RepID=A0ABS4KPG4_9CLOT|nr:heavy metal translocating P-type ATPase [Clostridium algifaecis]MBP2031361.1 Cd2+/Zn2+-exporting ATPase [Clostridium algifaecis]